MKWVPYRGGAIQGPAPIDIQRTPYWGSMKGPDSLAPLHWRHHTMGYPYWAYHSMGLHTGPCPHHREGILRAPMQTLHPTSTLSYQLRVGHGTVLLIMYFLQYTFLNSHKLLFSPPGAEHMWWQDGLGDRVRGHDGVNRARDGVGDGQGRGVQGRGGVSVNMGPHSTCYCSCPIPLWIDWQTGVKTLPSVSSGMSVANNSFSELMG